MESKAPFALCDKCPFKDRNFAKSTGPADAKIAVVSRSPGYHEAMNGKSFSGPSGKVLDHLLELHGSSREQVRATNVVLCQSDGQEPGFGMAQACCEPRLESEIADCDTIIAAGSEALYGILGESGIGYNRGFVHYRESQAGKTQRTIVTNNPAMVLRDDATFPELVRDFRLAISPLPTPKLPRVRWTEDVNEAREWADEILRNLRSNTRTLVAVDIEGGYPNLACIGFAIRSERAVVFGINPCRDERFVTNQLKDLLTTESVRYLWQFGKYDTKALRRFGINARVDHDTGLLSYALDERPGNPESGAGGHSLEWLLKDELGWPRYEPSSVRDFKARRGAWTGWPDELPGKRERVDLYEYNGMDTAGTLALYEVLKERAINDNVYDRPYKSQLLPLNAALTEVELVGNIFDVEAACDILEDEVWPKLDKWKRVLREISKTPELNPNSPKQLAELMYDTWGIEHDLDRSKIERKGKESTDKAVREIIKRGNYRSKNTNDRRGIEAFAELLDKWKELDKQRGTYLEGLSLRAQSDGRIYTDHKIHGTESGRLSTADPNMQNITRPKEGLPNIRRVFVADPGCQFISADLSQAELRAIAVLSGDEGLQAIYRDTTRSLHKEVAAQFYGENYTHEQYVQAKNINFGVAYWQSAYSFAQMYHMPQEEAQKYIDLWWNRFPKVWEWTKEMERTVLNKGEIQSPFGHKRRFYVIPQDQSGRIHVIKEGINFLPQNIATNITLHALTKLVDELDPELAQVRITVHDSIVGNCKEAGMEEVSTLMKHCMENAAREAIGWDFPFKADVSVGPTWGDLKESEAMAYEPATV
jgi:uracil-DNA glycosylase family 4